MDVKKALFTLAKLFVSGLIIFLLIRHVGLDVIIDSLKTVSLVDLVWALTWLAMNFGWNVFGLICFAKGIGKKVRFTKMFSYYGITWAAGLLMPGLIGQLTLIPLLKKEGLTYSEATAVCLLDKIFAFSLVILLTAIGMPIFFPQWGVFVSIGLIVCLVIGLVLLFTGVNRVFPKKLKPFFDHLDFFKKNYKYLFYCAGTTILKWGFKGFFISALLMSVGIFDVSYFVILSIMSIELLASMVPISFGGLGIREGVGLYLYSSLGFAPALVLSMYILHDVLVYGLAAVILLFTKV